MTAPTHRPNPAEQVRAELVKGADQLGDKIKENPAVEKALEFYDSQVKALHKVTNSETAKKILDALITAKTGLIKAIETASETPLAQHAIARVSELEAQAVKRIHDMRGIIDEKDQVSLWRARISRYSVQILAAGLLAFFVATKLQKWRLERFQLPQPEVLATVHRPLVSKKGLVGQLVKE